MAEHFTAASVRGIIESRDTRNRMSHYQKLRAADMIQQMVVPPPAYPSENRLGDDGILIFYLVTELLDHLKLVNSYAVFEQEAAFTAKDYPEYHPVFGMEWFMKSLLSKEKYHGLIPWLRKYYKHTHHRLLNAATTNERLRKNLEERGLLGTGSCEPAKTNGGCSRRNEFLARATNCPLRRNSETENAAKCSRHTPAATTSCLNRSLPVHCPLRDDSRRMQRSRHLEENKSCQIQVPQENREEACPRQNSMIINPSKHSFDLPGSNKNGQVVEYNPEGNRSHHHRVSTPLDRNLGDSKRNLNSTIEEFKSCDIIEIPDDELDEELNISAARRRRATPAAANQSCRIHDTSGKRSCPLVENKSCEIVETTPACERSIHHNHPVAEMVPQLPALMVDDAEPMPFEEANPAPLNKSQACLNNQIVSNYFPNPEIEEPAKLTKENLNFHEFLVNLERDDNAPPSVVVTEHQPRAREGADDDEELEDDVFVVPTQAPRALEGPAKLLRRHSLESRPPVLKKKKVPIYPQLYKSNFKIDELEDMDRILTTKYDWRRIKGISKRKPLICPNEVEDNKMIAKVESYYRAVGADFEKKLMKELLEECAAKRKLEKNKNK